MKYFIVFMLSILLFSCGPTYQDKLDELQKEKEIGIGKGKYHIMIYGPNGECSMEGYCEYYKKNETTYKFYNKDSDETGVVELAPEWTISFDNDTTRGQR